MWERLRRWTSSAGIDQHIQIPDSPKLFLSFTAKQLLNRTGTDSRDARCPRRVGDSLWHFFFFAAKRWLQRHSSLICAEGSNIPPYILHLDIHYRSTRSQFVDEALLKLPLLSKLKSLRPITIPHTSMRCRSGLRAPLVWRFLYIFFSSVRCHGSCGLFFSGKCSAIRNGHENPLTADIMNWFCRCTTPIATGRPYTGDPRDHCG